MKVSVCAGPHARPAPEVLPRPSTVVDPFRRPARPLLTFVPLVLAAGLLLAGCIDGSLAQRDDARQATPLGNPAEASLYRAQVNAETRRLLAENPEPVPQGGDQAGPGVRPSL